MLNILIAIKNNTYSEVWSSIDKEWRFSRTYYQVDFTFSQKDFLSFVSLFLPQAQFLLPQATFPPPFRWIFYIAKLLYKKKKRESLEDCNVLEMNAVNDKIYCEEEEEQVFGSLHFLFQAMQRKKWYFVTLKQGMETKQ